MSRSRRGVPVAGAALLVLAVLALAGLVLRNTDGAGSSPKTRTAAGGPATSSADDGGLVLRSADLLADGTKLSLKLTVHNSSGGPLLVTDLRPAPSATATTTALTTADATLLSALPRGGVRLAAGGDGVLLLQWSGPDCAVDPPDRVIGDLTYTASNVRAATATGLLLTGAAEELLRTTWRDTCEGESPAPPALDNS